MPIRDAGFEAVPGLVRQDSQRLILQRLRRRGEASRAELARDAALTHTAVGQIVKQLERAGYVRTLGRKLQGSRGQPATLLALDPRGAYAIGVRLDRARTETALADLSGSVLAHRTHDIPLPPPADAMELVRADVEDLSRLVPAARRRRIAGIGLARPYNLGSWLRQLDLPAERFAAWDGFALAAELERVCGLPVAEENDGTAAAIAELFHGQGRVHDDFLYVFIGPAIGGGLVLGGQAVRGRSGNAADIGVIPVAASRLASAPPGREGREMLLGRASLAALLRHLRFRGESRASLDAPAPTPAVAEWLEDCAAALVEPLLTAAALLDLPLVILDGDLPAPLLDDLIARLAPRLDAATAEARTPPALARGSFGAMAGALGAATLPLFLQFGPGAGKPGSPPRDMSQGGVHALVA
ncbi:MAG: ROK family protein [Rhodospirillales bacterium]|nr:ROK family protein [Rhodospirillales bacterium]